MTAGDADLLFGWANDPGVRGSSFRQDPIPWDDHLRWLDDRLSSPDAAMWILEVDGQPAGQIRYERGNAGIGVVSLSITAEQRGRGHSVELLRMSAGPACDRLRLLAIRALVLIGNEASRRAFLRAGYRETAVEEHDGLAAWAFELACVPDH